MTQSGDEEDAALRSVAFLNAESILQARNRAEHELVTAKEVLGVAAASLRLALEAGQLGDYRWNRANDLVTFGERAAEIFDLPPGQWISRDQMRQSVHPDDRERARTVVDDALRERRDFDVEYRVVRANGEVRWVCTKGRGEYDAEGGLTGMAGVFQDVTTRRRTEDALRDETRVLEILNGTGALIASSLDLPVLVQAVTDAATKISGAEFGAFFYNTTSKTGDAFLLYTLSGAPRDAFAKFGEPRATDLFGPTFRGEGPIRCDDVLLDPRYGQWAPHHGMPKGHLPVRSYLALPVISRDGSVIGGLFFGHSRPGVFTERAERLIAGVAAQAAIAFDNARLYDDTRRIAQELEKVVASERAARAEVERVSQLKDEFLATLSHELRTPLNAILGWSQLLLSHDANDETRRGIETIARNARAQTRLIDDLLDMSRIISGKVRLDVQPTDLGAVVDATMDSLRPSVDAKGIRIRKNIDPRAGYVSGDPNRLQQVIWNLLTNSVKFTPKGGSIEIILARVSSHLEVTVTDSGVGIEASFLPHVFDRFRQADASSTRAVGGLGLGLSIVKQIVELHGGSTRVLSEGTGKGATFIVSLPLAAIRPGDGGEHPSAERRLSIESEDIDLVGVKVLVVDDEPDARALIELALARCGAEVHTAASAREAMEAIAREHPDVLVSDIGMPVEDGYKLIRDVRALPASEGGATPAVALTAFARAEDRTRAMMAGYQIHVAKPIDPRELLVTISSLAGRVGRAPGA